MTDVIPGPAAEGEEKAPESHSESASTLFTLYFPKFCELLDQLPAKALRRLLKAIIAVPLIDAKPNLNRPEERTAYAIAERLTEAKMVITLEVLYEHHKQLQDATSTPTEDAACTTPTDTTTVTPDSSATASP